ncbi:unnamed protein product [Agarophyton chilense]
MISVTHNSNLDSEITVPFKNVKDNSKFDKKKRSTEAHENMDDIRPSPRKKRPLTNPRPPFSKRFEIELMESITKMAKYMADLANEQLRRENREVSALRDLEVLVSQSIEKAIKRVLGSKKHTSDCRDDAQQ